MVQIGHLSMGDLLYQKLSKCAQHTQNYIMLAGTLFGWYLWFTVLQKKYFWIHNLLLLLFPVLFCSWIAHLFTPITSRFTEGVLKVAIFIWKRKWNKISWKQCVIAMIFSKWIPFQDEQANQRTPLHPCHASYNV